MIPLDAQALDRLDTSIGTPRYERSALRRSIVHIGVGGFHRAHFATYIDELCAAGHTDWSIVGAGVLPHDEQIAAALSTQDYLYSLITRSPLATAVHVVGSIVDFVHATGESPALVDLIAQPSTQIVSMTVTEGGYPVDDTTGRFQADSPVAGPHSAFGMIAAALEARRDNNVGGITILSCDNVIGNGHVARAATLGEAERLGGGLADWIDIECTFPNSMVDRITPATSDSDRQWLADNLGLDDRWPVVTEPFRQWVIEDSFAADRLPLEEMDVLATGDVEPYELMKLRLLNAAHSCLAYLSALAGHETVHQAMADPNIHGFVKAFLDHEARPMVPPVDGVDLVEYVDSLIERFSNPAIGDQITRLCLDGSAKFPKFLLPTVTAQLEADGPVELSALALAGWCEYLTRGPVAELAADPLLESALAYAQQSQTDPVAFLDFADVFGADLARSERLSEAFTSALVRIRSEGVQSALASTVRGAIKRQ